ncbi:hypothetical protein ABK040_000405 [Willaertia magna]
MKTLTTVTLTVSLLLALFCLLSSSNFVESKHKKCVVKTCRAGLFTKPRVNFKPKTNGCGPASLGIVSKAIGKLSGSFTPCCNVHDVCYGTCNKDKEQCDFEFRECMFKVCKRKFGKKNKRRTFKERLCRIKAKTYFEAVFGKIGCGVYKDSQKEACVCKRK